MRLDLSPDQELFRETTRRFIESEAPLTEVRRLAGDPAGFEPDWWRRAAGLGWTSLLVPEAHGGASRSGGGLLDLVLVAEEMGRLVSPGPLVPVSVVAGALTASGTDEQREALLPAMVAGDAVAAWCLAEPGQPWDLTGTGLRATRQGDDFVLSGVKAPVEAAGQADHLLVTARTSEGPTQWVVPAATPGITIAAMESIDLVRRFASVSFDRVVLPAGSVLGAVGAAAADVEHQLQIALVLQNAETVGATDRVFAFTVAHAFDRYSFGRPLATYQALKHRFADMKLWLEACHATATASVEAVAAGTGDAGELVSVATSYIGDHAPEIIEDCIQMHGGIGVTWEHDIHLYLRRATVNWGQYGTPDDHRQRIAALLGL